MSTDAPATKRLLRLPREFLAANDFHRKYMPNVLYRILARLGFGREDHNIFAPKWGSAFTLSVQSAGFVSAEAMEPIRKALASAGIKSQKLDPKDLNGKLFRVIATDIPVEIARPYLGTQAAADAERLAIKAGGGSSPVADPAPGGTENSPPEEMEEAATPTPDRTTTSTSTQTNTDQQTMARRSNGDKSPNELKELIDELIDKNNLKGTGFPGRSPSQVYAGRIIVGKRADLAREIFTDNGLQWKEFEPKSGKNVIFRFYTGEWPDDEGAESNNGPKAAKKRGAKTTAKREPKAANKDAAKKKAGGRRKRGPEGSAEGDVQGLLAEFGEKLQKLSTGSKLSADEMADRVLMKLEEAGYACVSSESPFLTTEDSEGNAAIILDKVDPNKLKKLIVSDFREFLGKK